MSFNALTRAYDAPFGEPRTVGNATGRNTRGKLCQIGEAGHRRTCEAGGALIMTGLDLGRIQQPPASAKGPAL